jgi:deoxyribonuclease-1-like protein
MNKLYCLLFILIFTPFYSQTKLVSWNLENFGKSKSNQEMEFIANTLKDYDIVAIIEVVAGNGGAQAVARLADELNRKGSKWDYSISDPTTGTTGVERYAFVWKTNVVTLKGKPFLEQKYENQIDREPYLATFEQKGKSFTVAAFHAVPKNKHPENEIKYFKLLPAEYPTLNLIFAGDFNCPQSHKVFNPLKKIGYQSILVNQKTSLKQKCKQDQCLASEFDNMYYFTSKITAKNKGVISFYKNFNSLREARKISDHIPIWFEFSLN